MSWSSGPARRRGARDKARNSMDLAWNSIPPRTVAVGFGSASLRGDSERRPNAQVRVRPRSIETRLIITRGNCQSVLVVLASARLRGLDVASRYHYPPRPRKIPFMTPSRVAIVPRCWSSSSRLVSRAPEAVRARSGTPPGSRWGKISLPARPLCKRKC